MDAGLGIELTELAGGREDGLDITVVPRLVEGGLATAAESVEGADNKEPVIMAGHSISSVSVFRQKKGGVDTATVDTILEETEQVCTFSTECLGYDASSSQLVMRTMTCFNCV